MKNSKFTLRHILFLLLILFVCNGISGQSTNEFTVGSIKAKPGETVSGNLIVEKGVDEGTYFPITVINGAKDGPVLTLCAGMHGTEYVPIIILQNLLKEIDSKELSGTLILIHVANIPAFSGRSVYSNPIDNKNLNRVFPGIKNGTVSERIAFMITEEILKKSDYFIDLHSGEFNEQIIDYIYFVYDCPNEDLCKKSKMLALATGNKYLIPERFVSGQAEYSELAAIQLGVPSASLEWGDLGMIKPEDLEIGRRGIFNLMRTLGMLDGEAFINEDAIYLTEITELTGNYNGIFYPLVSKEQYIKKGKLLGYTTDYFGKISEKYVSPFSGLVVAVNKGTVMNIGDFAVIVAKINDDFDK